MKHPKKNILFLVCIVSLIFLGIFWLICNKSNREGNVDMAALSTDILDTVNSKVSNAGIDVTAYKAGLPGAMSQIRAMVESAKAKMQDPPDTSSPMIDANGNPRVDTTGSDYYNGKTFFTGKRFSDGFCKMNSDPIERNNQCSTLTTENCNQTDCCIVLNGKKCVAGDARGPTFQTDATGKDIDYAYYSYKNTCYGSCGKGINNAANPCDSYEISDTNVNEKCMKRLWEQSGCPNAGYLTQNVVSSLQQNSKAELMIKFKLARTDEPNYARCYGPNEAAWPVPCDGTDSNSTHLSARCLKRLFTEAGCSYQDNITENDAGDPRSKSEWINTFTGLVNAMPDETNKLTRCYGPDPLTWPDFCANTTDATTNLTPRCMRSLIMKSTCPNKNLVNTLFTNDFVAKNINTNKATFIQNINRLNTSYDDADMEQCYGTDKNNWPYFNAMGNSGIVTCNTYCKGFDGHSWGSDMPGSWKGATCVAAGAGRDISCAYRGTYDWRTPGILPCTCARDDAVPFNPYSMLWAFTFSG